MDSSVSLVSELSEYLIIRPPSPSPPFAEYSEFDTYSNFQSSFDPRFPPPPTSPSNQIVPGKMRKKKFKYSEYQKQYLQHIFETNMFPTNEQIYELADKLNIDGNTVKIWFRNHRAKIKSQNGGPEILAREKAKKHSILAVGQENIHTKANCDNGAFNVQEIRSRFRNIENFSLRELLDQAPAIPQHRPSSTSSTASLSSDATSESAELYSEAKHAGTHYRLNDNRYPAILRGQKQFENSLSAQGGPHFSGRNSILDQREEHFLDIRNLLPSLQTPRGYNYPKKVLPSNAYSLASLPDHKYQTQTLLNNPSKVPAKQAEVNVPVQNVTDLPRSQQQQEVDTYDEYSFENNLRPEEIESIYNADPMEQNGRLCRLKYLLTYLEKGGCDCISCISKN